MLVRPGSDLAKQRASIKWLLSKAYNNKVPDNLKEPFYRDHEDQEHLKPQIVHSLANAELYCLALSNIYSDPNYHNLNHCGIIQALARKGVLIGEPSDAQLTETVLIQTTPIKLSWPKAMIRDHDDTVCKGDGNLSPQFVPEPAQGDD
uniref:(California timema) hypothetical protein n=1 Tax=Timema californicum TaxID=61474 RepID=A0A7R9IWP1_TIMCA|nr:unnamed protein product [Timema californicum]